MLKKVKQRLVNWLLKDVEIQELVVKQLKVGSGTVKVHTDGIDFPGLTADPSLVAGRLWFRSDESKIKFSPDGSTVKTVNPVDWADIINKPSAYPPEAHTHARSDVTDFWNSPFWDKIPDKPTLMTKIGDAVVDITGSGALFTGLNGDDDRQYLLLIYINNNTGYDCTISLRFNADAGTNYGYTQFEAEAGSSSIFSEGSDNSMTIMGVSNGFQGFAVVFIRAVSGGWRLVVSHASSDVDTLSIVSGVWKNTSSVITEIDAYIIPTNITYRVYATLYKIL